MYYKMGWYIQVGNYKLGLLDKVEIHKSVDLLADTTTITVVGSAYNMALRVEGKVKRGDAVLIKLGQGDDNLVTEFEGYLLNIGTDDGNITFNCEDSLFLMRKPVKDKEFKTTSITPIAEYLAEQLGGTIKVDCTYDFRYDKFTIYKATAYDVLKQLLDDTKANIYLKGNVLHIHPAYVEVFGRVAYDFAINIEKADLQYKNAEDKSFEVEVEGIAKNGDRKTVMIGTPGGDRRSIKIYGVTNEATLKKRGEEEMKRLVYDGFEGSITGWLVPYVEPGYSARINDDDYEYKKGWYYVAAVTTSFDSSGDVRQIQLGVKLSANTPVRNG